MNYNEIQQLNIFSTKYQIIIKPIVGSYLVGNTSFPEVDVTISDHRFAVYVDDEYDDLKINSKLLAVCILMRTLESYDYADDYLVWCTQHGFNAANSLVKDHFQNLGDIVGWFRSNDILINSFISDYDFELNAGAAQSLRFNPDI